MGDVHVGVPHDRYIGSHIIYDLEYGVQVWRGVAADHVDVLTAFLMADLDDIGQFLRVYDVSPDLGGDGPVLAIGAGESAALEKDGMGRDELWLLAVMQEFGIIVGLGIDAAGAGALVTVGAASYLAEIAPLHDARGQLGLDVQEGRHFSRGHCLIFRMMPVQLSIFGNTVIVKLPELLIVERAKIGPHIYALK
jgi:hypothetical protein